MKNLLLVAALAVSSFSIAQKNIAVTMSSPTAGTTLGVGDLFDVEFSIVNVGDTLLPTDSVYFTMTVGGNSITGGSYFFVDRPNSGSPTLPGAVWGDTLENITFNVIQTSGAADFCVEVIIIENGSGTIFTEPDMTDNESCAQVNLVAGVGIFDNGGFSTGFPVEVYPNPVNEMVTVEFTNANAERVEIMDLTGKVIMTVNVDGISKNIVDVSGLASGLYMMNVIADGKIVASKKMTKN